MSDTEIIPKPSPYPENPVLLRFTRNGHTESQVRGAWVLVDEHGQVLDGAGDFHAPYFVRSAIKCLQALPLLESGAARRYDVSDAELALCVASHSGEPCHTDGVSAFLSRLGLGPDALRCGAHPPFDPLTRRALEDASLAPSPLHNNCSGKHTGFLCLEQHLGGDPERYLERTSRGQALVYQTLLELGKLEPGDVGLGTDGCSAPTFRLPLVALARCFASVCSPEALSGARRAAAERILDAVGTFPELVAGNRGRICTELLRESGARLFPKVGAESIYAVGERRKRRALALKVDDGDVRAMPILVVRLLQHLGWLESPKSPLLQGFAANELRNVAGLPVGTVELVPHGASG